MLYPAPAAQRWGRGISDSVLSKHASALETAGYVQIRKGYVGKRPRTWFSLTREGHAAYTGHVAALQSIPAALREHALTTRLAAADSDAGFTAFTNLVAGTPALRDHAQNMWLRHTAALAQAIAEESGLAACDPICAALAHFALGAPRAAYAHDNPRKAITRAFDLLEHGWSALTQIKA
ncbi:transcriptional regulator [Streptosporangium sp. CA-115845]|uniref:transcriptional regulator n=1 Tax=Streptosporangium sp. CA-115845 TaxID=3240071 RepID=UPI003D91AD9B